MESSEPHIIGKIENIVKNTFFLLWVFCLFGAVLEFLDGEYAKSGAMIAFLALFVFIFHRAGWLPIGGRKKMGNKQPNRSH